MGLGSAARRGGSGQIRPLALNEDTDIARAADRARLVERDAHPLQPELLEQQHGKTMREGLDQLEFRGLMYASTRLATRL